MKVAISLPDPVFESAERLSRRLRVSRSRLYAQAVADYLKRHSGDDITERLNKVYSRLPPAIDPAVEAATLDILRREAWK